MVNHAEHQKLNDSMRKNIEATTAKLPDAVRQAYEGKATPPVQAVHRLPTKTKPSNETPEEKEAKKAAELERRAAAFKKRVYEHQQEYGATMLDAFILYWTEPNATRRKTRWEMEKVFDIPRRLATWASRETTFNKNRVGAANQPRNDNNYL